MKAMMIAGIAALVVLTDTAAAQYNPYKPQSSPYSYGTGSNPNSNYVQPHFNSSGSFTQGHHRTNPNNTTLDNYGTRGNINTWTGNTGTRRPGW